MASFLVCIKKLEDHFILVLWLNFIFTAKLNTLLSGKSSWIIIIIMIFLEILFCTQGSIGAQGSLGDKGPQGPRVIALIA